MEEFIGLSPEEAQQRLLIAYREGNAGGFKEFMKRPLLNPVEQHDEQNKRKSHPMLVIGMVLLLVAVVAAWFFSH
jgi:hypothetical protein